MSQSASYFHHAQGHDSIVFAEHRAQAVLDALTDLPDRCEGDAHD